MASNFIGVAFVGCILLWCWVAIYRLVGFNFFSAASYTAANGVHGFNLPWSPTPFGFAAVLTSSKILLFLISTGLVVNIWWITPLDYMMVSRPMFAWAMDRLGPRWFTHINRRWASPEYLILLAAGISEFLLLGYVYLGLTASFWVAVQGLSVTAMVTVGLAAIAFPFSKRARGIWESSPFRTWRFLSVPVVTVAGVIYTVVMGTLWVFTMVLPKYRVVTRPALIMYVAIWAAGVVWYFVWSQRSRRQGIDIAALVHDQLPPE